MQPTDHVLHYRLAGTLVQLGDIEGYRRHCSLIAAGFATATNVHVGERMAIACAILPGSGVDLALLDRWTDQALLAGETHQDFPWFLLAKGLVHYRYGRYADASETMQKVAKDGDVLEVQALMVLAMAFHQLGERDRAVSALDQGLNIAEVKSPRFPGLADLPWHVWFFAEALIREARSLISIPAQ